MITWLILLIFVIVALIVLRLEHTKRIVKWTLLIFLGLAIYFSIMTLISSGDVDLNSPRGIAQAAYLYFGWIGKTLVKLLDVGKETVNLVGDAISFNVSG